jgi:hypothetical protein
MSRQKVLIGTLRVVLCALFFTTLSFTATTLRQQPTIHAASAIPHTVSNGEGQKPYMGWSSWSLESTHYPGYNTQWLTAAHVEVQADVMAQKLKSHGYTYINIDAGWWHTLGWTTEFDGNGLPTPDTTRFGSGGISAVADYVHAPTRQLKLGIYFYPGMDPQVYQKNDPILNTNCHTQDIVVKPLKMTNGWLNNYAIDYTNPCAQSYINSIADEFASWNIDYLKLDGVTPGSGRSVSTSDNRPDVQAWSQALSQTHHSIWLELSWSLDHSYLSTWQQYSNGRRIDTDVECYCNTLVTWDNSIKARFQDVVPWIGNAGPGSWNDLDSLDIGSATLDNLNMDERQSYMTLWAIESAPLYVGDDLTKLDSDGLSLLTNDEVIAIDQAGHPAHPISTSSNQQVWFTNNSDGSYTVALFNLDSSPAKVDVNWSDLGFSGSAWVHDLWKPQNDQSSPASSFSSPLNGHGTRLLRVTPVSAPTLSYEAESTSNTLSGSASVVDCSACSGGKKIGNMGAGSSVRFNTIYNSTAEKANVTISYVDGDAGRSAQLSVNGGPASTLNFHGTNDNNWNTVQNLTTSVNLNAGLNTLTFSTSSGQGPDLDRIVVDAGPTSYEAENSRNTLTAPARVNSCSACSDGTKINNMSAGSSLVFNNVYASKTGNATLTIYYVDGDTGRSAQISVNGGPSTTLNFHGTNNNNWNTVQSTTTTIPLNAGGNNTINISVSSGWGPDLDRITA